MSISHSGYKYLSIPVLAIPAVLFTGCMDEGPADPIKETLKEITITEINYHPEPADSLDIGDYEFIELKNKGTSPCDMSNVAFTSGVDYTFSSGTVIAAGGFYVLAVNAADYQKRYGKAPDAVYAGALKNSGETIVLTDTKTERQIFSASFMDGYPWPKKADGDGYTLVPRKPQISANPDSSAYWALSVAKNGSPGADEPIMVYISEVLTHTDPPDVDFVELYNPESSPVSIGSWYLTDAKNDPMKYKIPDGTIVPADGYLTISETQFNDSTKIASGVHPFRLDSHGEEVYLVPPSGSCDSGLCQGCKFGELENGVTIGRYVTSTGAVHYPRMAERTQGRVNSGVKVGPVVISEIMYNPPTALCEYIVITNISADVIPLYFQLESDHTWKLKGAGFEFPKNISINPGENIYIASDTIPTDSFRTVMKLNASVQVFSTSMDLSNGGEELSLMKPEEPYFDEAEADTAKPHMDIDVVDYKDSSPWPKEADGDGYALVRISNTAYGNDPINWKVEKRTP
jgi:hypothetical protein